VNGPLVSSAFWLIDEILVGSSSDNDFAGIEGATTEDITIKFIEKVTGIESRGDTDLATIGLSSMTSVLLIYELQQFYGRDNLAFRPADIIAFTTVRDIADFIDEQIKEQGIREEP